MSEETNKVGQIEQKAKATAPADKARPSKAAELSEQDLEQVAGGGALTFGREKLKGTSQ